MMNENKQLAVNELSDNELLIRYQNGEEGAFHELVNRYKTPLYTFLRRFVNRQEVVEDIFQETFLQIYVSQDSFDSNRPLKPWLFTIAANKSKDALRKMRRCPVVSMSTLADTRNVSMGEVVNILTSYISTPDQEVSWDERGQQVRQIISEMPENMRGILIMAYYEQFTYKHMAEILNIPMGTVKSRLHAAVGHFSKKWKETNRYLCSTG